MLQQAIRDQYTHGINPCQIPRAGQNAPSTRPNFGYSDVLRVVDELPHDLQILAMVSFGAHLRLGEALALRWQNIDFVAGTVEVSRSVTEVQNRQVETTTKTERSRAVVLPRGVAKQLRSYAMAARRDPHSRVFVRKDGSPLRHFHLQRAWKSARTAAGVEKLRFHDLRHVGLTALAEEGMPLRSIMYRAGHTTVDAALVYQHRADKRNRVEADALEAHMSRTARG